MHHGMLAALIAVSLGLPIAAITSPAHARAHTIKTNEYAVTRIGDFNVNYATRQGDTRIASAIRTFGRPSNIFPVTATEGCAVKWKRLGLRIEFYNFGVSHLDASDCEPHVGSAQTFTIESRKFRTWKGLRVGMREERVWDLHPNAGWIEGHDYYRDGFWLRENYSPLGDGGDYPILSAYIRNGRVSSIAGWIGGAGE